ncbi:GGDEF domain-containing protein [Steroidobacter cummioxidans]|uniref:GGDEF domain-containing protein n=1 Tax=Steroidobacter cummioxidans TaxID=1803913 RepID=UPI000E31E093|nr:diguanylate cyclase [Steroidobacter cummioxidans]
MAKGAPLNLAAVPDSPYAAELLRAQQHLQFSPEVEAEYVRTHLLDSHLLIRVTCALAAVLAVARGVEQTATGFPVGGPAIAIALVTIASVLLASVAWSSVFERLFLPFARVIVPVRNVVVAGCIAAAAADGQREMLMFLPLLLFGPFFFLGLSHRTALFTSMLTAASFVVHAALCGLALPVALRSIAFLLIALAGCAVAARHLERLSRTSFLETRLISQLAQHDTLTGTKNRRVFDEHLARLWPQAVAEKHTIAILLIDVDHFKAYNDYYGHQAGDGSLRQIAECLQSIVRGPLDVLSRYGGEEFVAMLFDVDSDQAMAIADRARRSVHELGIEHRGSRTSATITISIGVAVIEPSPARTPRGALQLADQALYAAKISGRNRVRMMNEADYEMLVTGMFNLGQGTLSPRSA